MGTFQSTLYASNPLSPHPKESGIPAPRSLRGSMEQHDLPFDPNYDEDSDIFGSLSIKL